jgi:hypothetical protein
VPVSLLSFTGIWLLVNNLQLLNGRREQPALHLST